MENNTPPEHHLTDHEEYLRDIAEKEICNSQRYRWVITTLCGVLLFVVGVTINIGTSTTNAKQQIAINTNRLEALEQRMDRFEAQQNNMNAILLGIKAQTEWMTANWPTPVKKGKYGE
jgi:hypothetical protein